MQFRKVTSIVNRLALESVETALRDIGGGISVTTAKGGWLITTSEIRFSERGSIGFEPGCRQ